MADDSWIDTVRVARDIGNVSALLPDGMALGDVPYTLLRCIHGALRFLSFEELMEEDVPPRDIWTHGDLLNEHFQRVKRRHKDDSGADESDWQQNAAAAAMIVG